MGASRWGEVSRQRTYRNPDKTASSATTYAARCRTSLQNEADTRAQKWHKIDTSDSAFVPTNLVEKEKAADAGNIGGASRIGNLEGRSKEANTLARIDAIANAVDPAFIDPEILTEAINLADDLTPDPDLEDGADQERIDEREPENWIDGLFEPDRPVATSPRVSSNLAIAEIDARSRVSPTYILPLLSSENQREYLTWLRQHHPELLTGRVRS